MAVTSEFLTGNNQDHAFIKTCISENLLLYKPDIYDKHLDVLLMG